MGYGCGADYRNSAIGEGNGGSRIVDDAPNIARILREGMSRCRKRLPPEHFLSRLGVRGKSYADMVIADLPVLKGLPLLPEAAVHESSATQWDEYFEFAVPEEQCSTPRVATKRLPAAKAVTRAVSVATKTSDSVSSGATVKSYRVVTASTADVRISRPSAVEFDCATSALPNRTCQGMAAAAMPGRRLANAEFSIPCMVLV